MRCAANGGADVSLLEKSINDGESPACDLQASVYGVMFRESRSSGLERKSGGKFHLKLNIGSRPIANKYHEGKVKRTLKRELKVPEIAEREANGTRCSCGDCCALM